MVAGAIIGAIGGAVGAAVQGGSWSQIALGAGIGAIGGATFGGLGATMLGANGVGLGGMAALRAGSGAVGSLVGQGTNIGDPCFKLNTGAVVGAALGGAAFGTFNSMATGGLNMALPAGVAAEATAAGAGLGARIIVGVPNVLKQGMVSGVGGILGKPECGCPN